jgi:solute carrier family 29 (equilibrative nucleoside transporter) protein 4
MLISDLIRALLVPLMLLCAAPRHHPIISGEVWAFSLSAILGVTNGVFGSVPMILAPAMVAEGQRELAGE